MQGKSSLIVRRELGFKQTRNGNHSPHSYNLTNRGRAADLALQFRLGLLPDRGPWPRLSNRPYPCLAPGYINLGPPFSGGAR